MFYLFCFAMIILGLIAVASAVVLISSRSDDVIVPLSTGILIYGVECALSKTASKNTVGCKPLEALKALYNVKCFLVF